MRTPSAIFSACDKDKDCGYPYCYGRRYRYVLRWPTGVDNDRVALGIFANPSTATPDSLDPTLKRWANYCRLWGYGWSVTCNVMAWRSTDPNLVPIGRKAIGENNDSTIVSVAKNAEIVVCGWGNLDQGRGADVIRMLGAVGVTPCALKVNKNGNPTHPLYLSSKLKPFQLVSR